MLMIKFTTTILGMVAFLSRIGHPFRTEATVAVGHHLGKFNGKLPNTQEFVYAERNRLATELLTAAKEVGQVGKQASLEDRERMDQLALRLNPYSDPKPARIAFTGTHSLVYSGSESGPTSGLVGPFVGKVTQFFCNETVYQNRVEFGPLQVSIFGNREPLSDSDIQVGFYRTQIHAWGQLLVDRNVDLWHNPGLWEHIFVGQVEVEGENWLLRVMNTPKLFILRQRIG
jgi:hypothetical protein